ncbi:hypothetical protein [Salinispira pacifica]
MKKTNDLSVRGTFSQTEDRVIIHPNDGYDLGLMTTDHPVHIFYGCSLDDFSAERVSSLSGSVQLKNECPMGTVELSLRAAERLRKPRNVRLYYHDGRLLISNV